VRRAAGRLRLMKLAYDPDELHDFAMDFLIHQVRRIGDDAEMNEKIFNQKSIEKLMRRLQFEFFGDENNDWRANSWKYGRELFVLLITTNFRDKHLQLDHKNVVLKAIKEVYLV
jgi:hypothetical protein